MKLKYIVAALGLAAAASAQASIANSAATNGSELFLSVWEQGAANGAPDQSFTLDLGVTFNQMLTTGSSLLASLPTSDSVWNNFLASSDLGSLQWAVIGSNAHNPLAIMSTVTSGQESTVATEDQAFLVSANTQLNGFVLAVNQTGTHGTNTAVNGESVNPVGTNAYFQALVISNFNGQGWSNSNAIGTNAEFTRATRNVATGGVLESVMGSMSFAKQGDGSYVLGYNVFAVPEPTGLGMALAGMFGIGFLSLRRKKQ